MPVLAVLLLSIIFRLLLKSRVKGYVLALLSVMYAFLAVAVVALFFTAMTGTLPYGLMFVLLLLVWSVPAFLLQICWTLADQLNRRAGNG
jgi:hypothetical protein